MNDNDLPSVNVNLLSYLCFQLHDSDKDLQQKRTLQYLFWRMLGFFLTIAYVLSEWYGHVFLYVYNIVIYCIFVLA